MTQNTRMWLHGLGAAFVGGAGTSLATIVVDSEKFNLTSLVGFGHVLIVAVVSGLISAGGYHHHIGLNTWESKDGNPPPPGSTGLFHAAILYPSRRALVAA